MAEITPYWLEDKNRKYCQCWEWTTSDTEDGDWILFILNNTIGWKVFFRMASNTLEDMQSIQLPPNIRTTEEAKAIALLLLSNRSFST